MAQERRHGDLERLAGRQWTVVRLDQLRAIGFTDHDVQALLRRVILHRAYRGIYLYGTARPPWQGVLLAAQWSCGQDAYITGRTALGYAGVRGLYLGEIEIAVPRRAIRARRPPIHLVRRSDRPVKLRRDGLLRIATVADALADCAMQGASVGELTRLLTSAIHLGKLEHPAVREMLERRAGQPGVAVLREAYARYIPNAKAKSELERSFDRGLRTRPHIPEPERNEYIAAGGRDWEVDRYWPEQRVGVELHGGGFHAAAEDLDKDTFKAAKLLLVGVVIIAFTDVRWELEPEACLDDLEQLLAQRGWRRAA